MKFGMLLLILVMALSLAGSLIPQGEEAMRYVKLYGAQAASLLIRLGFTDLFHTWYFYALLGLLCVNLLLCSILRFPRTLKAADGLRSRALSAPPDHALTPDQAEKLQAFLLARGFRPKALENAQVYEAGKAGFFGSFLVHLSILVILLFGSLVLLTPEISDRTVMPGETLTLADGATVTCLSFHIQDAAGKLDYASLLSVKNARGTEEKEQEIRVNAPLRFGSYKIYQQTYGTAGRVKITNHQNGAEETMYLTEPAFLSIDGRNGIFFHALYPGFIQDEAGNYTLITQTDRSYADPVYDIQSVADGMSASVLAKPGEEINIGSITFSFLSPVEYPGLRIKHVSAWLYGGLYSGFFLMVAALYLCFFRTPVCVGVREEGFCLLSPKPQQDLRLEIDKTLGLKEEE